MFEEENDDSGNDLGSIYISKMFEKTQELMELIEAIAEYIDEENHAYHTINHMREDAMIMAAKIHSGTVDSYTVKMENAAIIRKCGMDIHVSCHGLESFAQIERQYTDLIRQAIDEIRILFKDWIKTFDSSEYFGDEWGLFVPPWVEE